LAFLRRYSPIIDMGCGVSRHTYHVLQQVVGLPAARAEYIPTGVQTGMRKSRRAPGEPIHLGYVGRFDVEKRIMDIVGLCIDLDRIGVHYSLTVAGQGGLERELRNSLRAWIGEGRARVLDWMQPTQLYEEVYPE